MELLTHERIRKGITQQEVADHVGVSRRTIQNWESGLGRPDVDQAKDWIEAVGENPMVVFTMFVFGEEAQKTTADERRSEVLEYIRNKMSDQEIDILYYMFTGGSYSTPYSYIQKIGADLACPLEDRIKSSTLIGLNYAMARDEMELRHDAPRVDIDALRSAVNLAKEQVIKGKLKIR